MEIDYGLIGSLVATGIAVISFFNSRKKDQSELDKQQDIDIKVIQEKQQTLNDRIIKVEATQQTLEGKLSKEVEKVYDRLGKMEDGIREDFRSLTSAILNKQSNEK